MHPYRETALRPKPPAVIRPALRVRDVVRVRTDGRVGRVAMISDDVYIVAFAADSCGLFFRAQILKLDVSP